MQRKHPVTVAYGSGPDQVGDLYRPVANAAHAPIVCLIHGGFWRLRYGRNTLTPLADDLVARGFVVWNFTYRRIGSTDAGWPATLQDVGAAIDHLAQIADVDVARGVTVMGHSAGGQLALWSACRGVAFGPQRVRVIAAVGLAAVADLRRADALGLSRGAVKEFLGDEALEFERRCRAASPMELLPLGVPQLLIHGTRDADVPVEMTRAYARAAGAAGDAVEFIELENASHMDLIDPDTLRGCGVQHFTHDAGDLLTNVGAPHPLL